MKIIGTKEEIELLQMTIDTACVGGENGDCSYCIMKTMGACNLFQSSNIEIEYIEGDE